MAKMIFRTSAELRTPLKDRVTARVAMEREIWHRLADEAHMRDTSVAEILRVLAERWLDLLDAANQRHSYGNKKKRHIAKKSIDSMRP